MFNKLKRTWRIFVGTTATAPQPGQDREKQTVSQQEVGSADAVLGANLTQDAQDAEQALDKMAEDVKAEAHKLMDDIKRATDQAQVHELVDNLRVWLKAHFGL
jgi:hypothetical protein